MRVFDAFILKVTQDGWTIESFTVLLPRSDRGPVKVLRADVRDILPGTGYTMTNAVYYTQLDEELLILTISRYLC